MFGCAITIPAHEKRAASDLCRSAWIALSLTNDLFSWDKEHRDAIKKGQTYVPNALYVIMQEHNIGIEEAKGICRKEVRVNIKEYLNAVERVKREKNYSIDLLRFMDGLIYSIGGNLVWSLSCPRYHADAHFSNQQVEWMTSGIPDHLRKVNPVKAVRRQQKVNGHTNGYSEKKPTNGNGFHVPHLNGQQSIQVPSVILSNDGRSLNDVLADKYLPELPVEVGSIIASQFQVSLLITR